MTANPIGLVVTAIAALAAGIIYAYNHSERFRKIVDAAWAAIKVAAEAVVKWFMDTAWPLLKRVWEGIGDGWNWLVTKASEVWTGVREKFTAIVDFVKGLPVHDQRSKRHVGRPQEWPCRGSQLDRRQVECGRRHAVYRVGRR
ncbi:hypothetical protein ACNQQN_24855 [Mycobacteroides chelonae]|uniref:hypothetical protein n=1 Tax=Mycobacteroides chelonae TaxID=1774 RepID=UPI003AAC8AE0